MKPNEIINDQEPNEATVAAAKLAKENDIDLSNIKGSGHDNRITVNDVKKLIALAKPTKPAKPVQPAKTAKSAKTVKNAFAKIKTTRFKETLPYE